ncbi:NAD(P)-binding protein [Listeria rocourtiae]|uniref:FAD-dependent monooxygenase n=1 Tax=Listeria rocourtiae TaxID=647910 RepID=UPI00162886B9|nr:FAD-dependent monooxygenase [Listeria rocourtiae]MBC1433922.1 NAD(P)-binding protein [Listeria rocourtiae]
MTDKFLIIGGGIAGLMTGIALQQAGFQVEIFEKVDEVTRVGAGITVAPNGIAALEQLGLAEQVKALGNVSSQGIAIMDETGKPITKLADKKHAFPIYAIHRADLRAVLLAALEEGTLKQGQKCDHITQNDSGVVLQMNDGSEAIGDYVIVADGIHSTLRDSIFGKQSLRYANYTCWRGIAESWSNDADSNSFTETWGTKGRIGIVPLSNKETYWFAVIAAPENSIAHQTYELTNLVERFGVYHQPICDVLEATNPDKVIRGDIYDLEPMKSFVRGRVVLVGDAAHAMTPNLGQGGCQAMEDAIILRNCLQKMATAEEAFEAYSKVRVGRTKKIIERSRLIGKIGQLEAPFICRLRNMMMRLAPASSQRKQLSYLYDVELFC